MVVKGDPRLLAASVVTWTVWLAKALELGVSRRSLRRALAMLSAAKSLSDVAKTGDRTVDALLLEASLELAQSSGLPEANVSGRIAARLERVQAAAARRALIGTNVLATIGSSAPFVGLFGTCGDHGELHRHRRHRPPTRVVAPGMPRHAGNHFRPDRRDPASVI